MPLIDTNKMTDSTPSNKKLKGKVTIVTGGASSMDEATHSGDFRNFVQGVPISLLKYFGSFWFISGGKHGLETL